MIYRASILLVGMLLLAENAWSQPGQVSVSRVEMMPNQPAPYNVRDWEKVAQQYDSLVFQLDLSGQYLPLTAINPSGVNYPQRSSFRMHTYVGTNSPFGNEAINVLPTLVGSTLVGIDKSDQFGQNWVLMAQDFFNRANGENLYLNNAGANSGGDWWYDMMPNVYFYQLYDLYPDFGGDADLQFAAIANQLLKAVQSMGGHDAPWTAAFMNYRAWKFKTMEPNNSGVPEPEAAGAFAWILYHAYKQTGEAQYLKGAEWAIEFLDQWASNPSYEVQLPYGTYIAAKMNAELGTNYNIEKMVSWSFDKGFLRNWGTIVGKWGGFDVSGLVGEANDNGNDYAFQMNGMQQAAALVPMVRYDKRFARAIGKWVLNLTNASRLFFHAFLPATLQDASEWSSDHDPNQVIGYEALREGWQGNAPFSTGDAVRGGWAATNLALYGTSAVGYLGAMVEKTNVDKILKIDLLKTDFYAENAYPTYLLYNSHASEQSIELGIGENVSDIYDALSESFLLTGVKDSVALEIPADEAVLIVVCPAGGAITYQNNKMMIDGVIVDYDQHTQAFMYPPRFKALAAEQNPIEIGSSISVFATVSDRDSEQLLYQWSVTNGTVDSTGNQIIFTAPEDTGTVEIQCIVSDSEENKDSAILSIEVVNVINQAPQILQLQKSAPYVMPQGSLQLTCIASDDLSENLIYEWSSSGGSIEGMGGNISWTAPSIEEIIEITVTVRDAGGLSTSASTAVLVKEFTSVPGNLIAHYPFSGDALDISGNELHGTPIGVVLTDDAIGQPRSAYYFNGGAQHIFVDNSPILNIQDAITVSCWFEANALPDKETFLLSHGSWQNRWKLSITPERRLRWTINSSDGIRDLDASIPLRPDSFYHVSATYDGTLLALYLGGNLHSYQSHTGPIRTTSFPFLIGQMLPDQSAYNFKGVIDEVKIYDFALIPDQIEEEFKSSTTSTNDFKQRNRDQLLLYPNPVSEVLMLTPVHEYTTEAVLTMYDFTGRQIMDRKVIGIKPIELNVSHLKQGVYLIVLKDENGLNSKKFLKW